jgi:hypothetical protein
MNERKLSQLLRRIALGSIPWSVAGVGVACSESTPSVYSPEGGSDATAVDGQPAGDSGAGGDTLMADAPQIDSPEEDTATGDVVATDAPDGDAAADGDALLTDAPDSSNPCGPPVNFPGCGGAVNYCVVPDASTHALVDGSVGGAACMPFCVNGGSGCELVNVDAQQLVRCFSLCTGRRPAGLITDGQPVGSDIAAYLQEIAYLEAASVPAFASLGEELRHHGAPRSLVRSAVRAARDELRHARTMGALARRHGAICRKPRVAKQPIRALAEIAVENAGEGCVRETFGALLAVHQSLAAGDVRMRAAMKTIARDEARHAALAWKVGAWLDRQLTPAERRRVANARRAAVEEIASSVDHGPSPSVRRFAGLPSTIETRQMVARMRTTFWQC